MSRAVWVPFLWMFLAGSRYVSEWLNLGEPAAATAVGYSEGSPLDATVFLALIVAGVWILAQRKVDWATLLTRNAWICLFFLFALTSVLWADEPVVALKRWIKGAGNLVMALVILTEVRPYRALGLILRRLALVLVPLSILFIRFYPELGRQYHMGAPMYSGVAFSKNSLGQLCFLLGIYFFWDLLPGRVKPMTPSIRVRYFIDIAVLAMIAWLLRMADSATSTVSMLFAASFMAIARLPPLVRSPRSILGIGLAVAAIGAILEASIGIKARVIEFLGRDPDLTSRTPVWDLVTGMVPNPWIGAGYESFWSGERLTKIWTLMGFESGGIIQAHNGYIETYLNLGIVGLTLLVIAILSGLVSSSRQLRLDYSHAILRMSFILVAVIYNYTEAAYKPLNNVFLLLLFCIFELQASRGRAETATRREPAGHATREVAHKPAH